ncbi:hypothetical protein [Vibrio harveyi]|uniref:hypothetical protein n=1 Tax=Vibrio harveyi TaxID=669 RepID=UPI0009385A9B|nr:hypothetical protein [Vibrio harveyi]APP09092.1 hypothetical protein BG259_27770 [Vibrio harveyi]
MKNLIQRHHSTLSLLVKHLIQTPAVLLLVIAAYVLATDIHFNYNQGSVTAVTEAAWLGKAEKGQIRIFECTDGTPIDRATIVGNANPCPNSEVKTTSIADSARVTTQREREQIGLLYLSLVIINLFATSLFSTCDHIKAKYGKRSRQMTNQCNEGSTHQTKTDENNKTMEEDKKVEQ